MQITMPKWLLRKTVADMTAKQIRRDEESLYEAEKRLELAAHEVGFYRARIDRLQRRNVPHVVVQLNPHRH